MNREQFQSRVKAVMDEKGVSTNEAIKIVENEHMEQARLRLNKEEEKHNMATEKLLNNPESKTVVIPVDEFIVKDQAMAKARSTIKVNTFHFVSELSHGEKETWLVASEHLITAKEALIILERLNSQHYSPEEIDVIVTKQVPFDLR